MDLGEIALNVEESGDPNGAPLVFANSLGTDIRAWDPILPFLPDGLRIIRYDMRGHGRSDVPTPPYKMGSLVNDAALLLDKLGVRDAVVVGLSIGGMVAQGLAVKRLDQVRALVLSNTAVKMGTAQMWHDRIAKIEQDGMDSVTDAVMERWFSPKFRATPELAFWADMMRDTPVDGYLGCCAAIAGTDMMTPTSGLRLPVLGIAGSEDGASPPDLVRETVDLIPGSEFALIRGAGHLPQVEAPQDYADLLSAFLKRVGHI